MRVFTRSNILSSDTPSYKHMYNNMFIYNFCHRHQWLHIVYIIAYALHCEYHKKHIHSKGSWFLSIPGGAVAYSLELGCDPKRILELNQNNLFFAVKRRDAEKVQAAEETVSKKCPCSNVHMNRDISMSHPEAKLAQKNVWRVQMFLGHHQDILFWIHHEGLQSSFQCLLWSQFFLLHRAPCQLLIETYGLDVNHKDGNGQTCSSTAISMQSL